MIKNSRKKVILDKKNSLTRSFTTRNFEETSSKLLIMFAEVCSKFQGCLFEVCQQFPRSLVVLLSPFFDMFHNTSKHCKVNVKKERKDKITSRVIWSSLLQ